MKPKLHMHEARLGSKTINCQGPDKDACHCSKLEATRKGHKAHDKFALIKSMAVC